MVGSNNGTNRERTAQVKLSGSLTLGFSITMEKYYI